MTTRWMCHRLLHQMCERPERLGRLGAFAFSRLSIPVSLVRVRGSTPSLADKKAKDRSARGARHGMAKLTDAIVREIRAQSRVGVLAIDLAARYSVDKSTIHRIKSRRMWVHEDALSVERESPPTEDAVAGLDRK